MKRIAAIGAALLAAGVLTLLIRERFAPGIAPLSGEQVELTKVIDNVTYKLDLQGHVYRVDGDTGQWHYIETAFHPTEMAASYVTEGDVVYRVDLQTGQRFPTTREFSEDFEGLPDGVDGLRQLIGPQRGWGGLTLQSPETPQVSDYVALRQQILEQGAGFGDAVVAPNAKRAHAGEKSLLCMVPAPTGGMITSKASLSTPLMYFRKGEDFWFRGHYFVESARPLSLMDLECEWMAHHGGIRVCLNEAGALAVELKALHKPMYRQLVETPLEFPQNRWVDVLAHFVLSDDESQGVIQLWQDGVLLVDTRGITLPLPRAIYSSLEIGISAHSFGDATCTLWVDDVTVSATPLRSEAVQSDR